ncbi:MAG: transposase [Thiohalomonadaceae bacterium]
MPTQAYYHVEIRLKPHTEMTESSLKSLIESHGFSIANVSYRLDGEERVRRHGMVLRTSDRKSVSRLADALQANGAVYEFSITPTAIEKRAGCRLIVTTHPMCMWSTRAQTPYSDDHHDARWLAHMERLGILPVGYIYPREQREIRDLLRRRSQLVQQRTAQILNLQTLVIRETGRAIISNNEVKKLAKVPERWPGNSPLGLAVGAHIAVMRTLNEQIDAIEAAVLARAKPNPTYQALQSIAGVGKVLGLTILLESGDMARFAKPGNFASYCRCVDSKRLSNGKKNDENNAKNGNRYLAWAFVEAANFAVRYNTCTCPDREASNAAKCAPPTSRFSETVPYGVNSWETDTSLSYHFAVFGRAPPTAPCPFEHHPLYLGILSPQSPGRHKLLGLVGWK